MKTALVKNKIALSRLKEIGVEIKEFDGFFNFILPRELRLGRFVEAGFLMAQLVDYPEYPEGFDILSDLPTKLFKRPTNEGLISFVESHPHGLEYRVYKKK